jgi:polysaccharide pyruvyl transferase WcaK-like protein
MLRELAGAPGKSKNTPRVGFFGLLGSGNLGNDASFEVVFTYLRAHHPDAVVDAMVMGPVRLKSEFGIEAIPLLWYKEHEGQTSGVASIMLKVIGKGVDAIRTANWVRKHDVVIVPGMGILEATLPLRATGTPYALFLLCASGRLFATKVALVSVGANDIKQRLTRWLFTSSARLSSYRSYRDVNSRQALLRRGLDVAHDDVYPDLVFGYQTPPDGADDDRIVGVGVMAYYGGNEDRRCGDEIYLRYIDVMKQFVGWLVDTGHRIRLFWSDNVDDIAVQDIMTDLRAKRPELDPSLVVAEPFSTLGEMMREMALVGTVVGTRYHTVLSALKLGKPTISIGYSGKHEALMAGMGMSDFCQSALSVDTGRLIEQFTELEHHASELRRILRERSETKAHDVDRQLSVLSTLLNPVEHSARVLAVSRAGQ